MAVKGRSKEIKAPRARLAFAQGLFELRVNDENGRKEWQTTLLYPKGSDMTAINEIVAEAAEQAWPGKVKQLVADGLLKNPVLDGDGPQGMNKKKGVRLDGFAGQHFLRVKSGEDYRPKLFDRKVMPVGDKSGPIYSGCYVLPVIHAYAWDNDKGGKGVSFGISMLQLAADGERLGGDSMSTSPDEHFEAIPDEGDAPAETKKGDGAAGLFG